MKEKRKNERYKAADIPVRVSFSFSGRKVETRAKMKDISKGGVFLTLDGVLLKGTKCELVIEDRPVTCVVTDNKKQQKGCGLEIISEGQAKTNFEMFVDILRLEANASEREQKQKEGKAGFLNVRKKTILYIASENYGFEAYVTKGKFDAIYDFLKCESENAARAALKSGEIVLIVIDTKPAPSLSGVRLLESLKRDGYDVTHFPVIFVGAPLSQHERDSVVYMGIRFEYLETEQANPTGLRPKVNRLLHR